MTLVTVERRTTMEITKEQLDDILRKHALWINNESGGERANLSRAKNLNFPIACPEEGSFIGFKKCQDGKIVKLKIPVDALRCSATGRKCRCSKAKVLSITNIDGTDANVGMAISKYDRNFIYKVGETIEVPNFNTDRWDECSTGIHFFITRQEAVDYIY